jgi:TonB-linked SusC/RagA family outer membrane protein
MRRSWLVGQFISAFAVAIVSPASAQSSSALLQVADAGPAFYRLGGVEPVRIDVRSVAALQRQIALDLDNAALPDAIDAVSQAAHISIFYTQRDVPSERRVTLQATKISVAGALRAILADADLDVGVSPEGTLTLAPRGGVGPAKDHAEATVTVRGTVTDATTHAPLAGANVSLEGTGHRTVTGINGAYRFSGVLPGAYRLIVRRLGYLSLRRAATVAPPATTVDPQPIETLDVALTVSAAELDQVITTETGDETRKNVGYSVDVFDPRAIVESGVVANLGDVVSARVPGVQVFLNGGLTGPSPQINIRGENSFELSNQPLLIIDGVRVANTNGIPSANNSATTTGRFNDIPPDQIESIEVVRGPAAAALYGTDAANGAILIRTHRGSGQTRRVDFFAEQGVLTVDRSRFQDSYYPWGHTTGDTVMMCPLQYVAQGLCTQDSVTHFSPLKDKHLSPLGTGGRGNYGASLSGGTAGTRYFASGVYENEVGVLQMSPYEQSVFGAQQGALGIDREQLRPNGVEKISTRENLTIELHPTLDLLLSGSYLTQHSRAPSSGLLNYAEIGPGYKDANNGFLAGLDPSILFESRNSEQASHLTGGATLNWRPQSWLTAHATGGVDASDDYLNQLTPAGDGIPWGDGVGSRGNLRTTTTLYSVDLGATASLSPIDAVSTQTSVGAQYNQTISYGTFAGDSVLAPGATYVGGGAYPTGQEQNGETIVAGAYVQEQLGLNDRLFVTGAVRFDGASSFGQNIHSVAYPKVSASWLVSREPFMPHVPGLSSLRLRVAYGESGVQPDALARITQATLIPVVQDGIPGSGVVLGPIGNPSIRPELQHEFETGVDAEVARRVSIELTYYNKKSTDAIVFVPNGPSAGGGSIEENVGSVRNWGYEASLSARIVDGRWLTWDASLNGSINHNQLLRLAPGVQAQYGLYGSPGIVPGYPLDAFFDYPVSYNDANHNGIIEPNEITIGTTPRYIGQSYPQSQMTASTTLGFLNALRLSALLDYRGGFKLVNDALALQCYSGFCQDAINKNTPLAQQAQVVAVQTNFDKIGFYEDASFARLREVSLTYTVPASIVRHFAASRLSVALAVRNLFLWTNYKGVDPESNSTVGQPRQGAFSDQGGVPPVRYWTVRVNVGF